jgi:hypothetical protein
MIRGYTRNEDICQRRDLKTAKHSKRNGAPMITILAFLLAYIWSKPVFIWCAPLACLADVIMIGGLFEAHKP